MSSPMPMYADICAVCFEPIRMGEHAIDRIDRAPWDVHSGRCASEAGIDELD